MVYFLKVNVAIALFYAFYRLFFYKDTFFAWRRTALMCFFAVSAAVPLFDIQTWIVQQEPMVAMADLYAAVVLPEITLTPQSQMDWKQLLVQGIDIVYWLVVALLALRFVVQLAGIFRLARRCPVQEIDGTTVHLLPRAEGPFSFFRWIFVCPGAHSREELNEILTHERTHVCQWHSVDVLVGELACIVCWFNPFAWLMKREIRTNLEYMADEKVLETGYDSRTYQYHLLGLSHHKAAATIYNSFNVLPLKRRITMMNKRRTREIGRTKYLMFLPLAALLMIVSNIEAVARATQKIASEVIESVKPDETAVVQAQSQSQGTVTTQSQTALTQPQQGKPEKVTYKGKLTDEAGNPLGDVQIITDRKFQSTTVSTVNTDGEFRVETSSEAGIIFEYTGKDGRKLMRGYRADELAKMGPDNLVIVLIPVVSSPHGADPNVFEVVEKMPEFPNGGMPGLMKYLSDNIRYPEAAKVAGIQGRVTVVFVVDKDGSITNVKTLRGVDAELDKEAIRVISSMPKWIPGMQKGKAVKVRYTVPVMFRLPVGKPAQK
ncbi:M56 family metallopeptidase [uncultured Bacteroides sp.]|uniref:M56 family metallopeptidase n=1 Tax=uncultured Bacteroides sp. TaxID=162156 RepID=UPI002605E022|nr:M56 family metallopeptidase [uncultured Bacteroides sp.]